MSTTMVNGQTNGAVAKHESVPMGMDAPSPFVFLRPLPLLLPEMGESLKRNGAINIKEPQTPSEHLFEIYRRTREKVAEYDESSKKSHNLKMRDVILGFMSYIPSVTYVRRDGEEKAVDSRTLVPGDIVMLKAGSVAGSFIDADMRVIQCSPDCKVYNHAILPADTVNKPMRRVKECGAGTRAYSAENMVWCDTFLVAGSAVCIVVATGDHTVGARVDAWCEGIKSGGDLWSGAESTNSLTGSDTDKLCTIKLVEDFEKTIDVHSIAEKALLLRADTPLDMGLSTNEHDRRLEVMGENRRSRIPNVEDGPGGKCKCAVM